MKINEYNIETSKLISPKTIAIISDIHKSKSTKEKLLNKIIQNIQTINPTQIFIPGDLYNVDDTIISDKFIQVYDFLESLSKISEVFYVQGNAELKGELLPYNIYNNSNPKIHLLCSKCESFTNKKKECKIDNIINIGDMNIGGLELDKDFYYKDEKTKVELLLTKYSEYLKKISNKCDPENFNVLLCHDPIIADAKEMLKNFDLVVSGHNHGGVFSAKLKPLFKLVGANLELLYPKYTKGMLKNEQTSFLVSEGITKFHSEFGPLEKLERCHNGTIEVIKVKTLLKK